MAENLEESNIIHNKIVEDAIKAGTARDISSKKGKLIIDFPHAISQFENAMHKFPVKKVLYKSVFRGRGLEFESYRLYTPDDDASLIDWKASLRANDLLSKQYVEERNLNVYFLVDVSNSMLFGSSNKLKSEFAAEFAASLGHLVVSAGDNLGLIMFSDDVVKVIHPSIGKNQFGLFMHTLSDSSFYGGGFDIEKAIDYVLKTIKSSYTVFILISDFIKTKKDNLKDLRLIGSKYETFAIMIRDPLDENLPVSSYQYSFKDPYSGRQMVLDPKIAAERYRKNVVRQKGLLKEMLKRSHIDLLELSTDRSFAAPVSTFLRGRAMEARL
jgi:uncharacterized protein (DUF58 family)